MSAPVLSWLFVAYGKYLKKETRPLTLPSSARPPGQPTRKGQPARRKPCKFKTETLRPSPQSQSFSRSYGSILPTSLIYIVLSTRGCSPWRPDAVMSTTWGANKSLLWIFKGRRERIGLDKNYRALPAVEPYRRAIRFQGHEQLKRKENSSRGPRRRLHIHLCCHTLSTSRFGNINPIPFR